MVAIGRVAISDNNVIQCHAVLTCMQKEAKTNMQWH